MRSTISAFFIVLLVVGFSLPAFAQKESGSIIGTVTDMDGLPLEGVTVTATDPSRGPSITYTDRNGLFRFPVLPPSTYEVKASLEGFQTAIRNDVRLFVGNTITVNFTISQTLEESLEISGESPTVDVTTTASSKTVAIETIENLPKFDFALDLFTLTPGVDNLSYVAYGAGGSQANAYWLDGVDMSSPVGGSYWIYPNYNWLEEVQVIGIGAPAEYGGFSGVISNSVTRSGSNQYHGLFETFFENQSLLSSNTPDETLAPDRVDLITNNTFQLSGRVIKDKLWFFGSGQYDYSRTAPFGFPPIGPETFVKIKQPRYLGKMTYKVNQNNTVQGFAEWDNYKTDGYSADSTTAPEATGLADAPEWVWNGAWVSLFSPDTVLDVRYSGYQSTFNILPRNGQTPQHGDAVTGLLTQNYWRNYFTDRNRNQVNGSVSHYAKDFIKGSHDFKFGAEYEHAGANRAYSYTGGVYYYDYNGAPYYRTLWEGYDTQGRIRRTSLYAQDDWHITDRLDLSIGVRYDHNHGFLADAPQFEYTTTPVAPRLGFVFDLKGDQKTVLKAHYGQYYDKPVTFYVDGIDDIGTKTYQYWYGSYWGTYRVRPGKGFWTVDPNLKQPYVEQFTVGVDQLLPKGISLSAHYIYRSTKNFVDDVTTNGIYEPVPFVDPVTGQTITVYNQLNANDPIARLITNPPGTFRHYNAVEVYGGKRFSKKLTLNGSMVWSRARGNIDNTDGSSDGFSNLFNDPNYLINADGIPTYDPTWEFKVTGYYEFPWEILGSFYYSHFSGTTWTPEVRIPGAPDGGINQGPINIFGLPRGSERLAGRNVVNMRAEKAVPISAGNLKFTADIFNLFNTGYVTDLETRYDRGNYQQPITFTQPREVRLGIRYEF